MLSDSHFQLLQLTSGLTPGVIEARGYYTATTPEELAALGFAPRQQLAPALVIPWHGVDGQIVGHQIRPDNPRTDERGRAVKYETPLGAALRLDVPPLALPQLDDPSVPLWITEGSRKADSAVVRGLCCVALSGVWNFRGENYKGGSVELADWDRVAIKDRVVYVAFDSDAAEKRGVRLALQRLAAILARRGAKRVIPIRIPSTIDNDKIGLDDYFARGGAPSDLILCADESLLLADRIVVNNRSLAAITASAIAALAGCNSPPTLFVRGGELVRLQVDERDIPTLRALSSGAMRGALARCASWVKVKATKDSVTETEVSPPLDVVDDVLSLGHWPEFPPIVAISEAPVLAPDLTLARTPGYDERSRFYVSAKEPWPAWDGTAASALSFLTEEVLGDFPFASSADQAHALALMLLTIVRPAIEGPTPLHLIDAPVQATGKSLLARVCLAPSVGRHVAATSASRDEEEWRKKIATSLLEGRPYMFLDNLSRKVDSDALAGVLTSTEWNDRALGTMTSIKVPVRCTWAATANNAELSRDITRRTLWIRLDAGVERPDDRSGFRHPDLEAWVMGNRTRIVAALLALVEDWLGKGAPKYVGKKFASYEDWTRIVGGVLQAAGVKGFLGNIEELRASANSDEIAWAAFYARWDLHFGSTPVKAGQLLEEFEVDEELAGLLGDRGEMSRKTRLGHLLRRRMDVVTGGFRVERCGEAQRALLYRLREVSKPHSLNLTQNLTGSNGDFDQTALDSTSEVCEVYEDIYLPTRKENHENP